MRKIIFGFFLFTIAIVVACSITSKNGLDKNVQMFLADFQSKLSGPEEDFLKLFSTSQKKEEIAKAIAILQNRDTTAVSVKILFNEATANWEGSYLSVQVPLEFIGKGDEQQSDKFSLKLFQRDGRYFISSLDAEDMYKHFSIMKMEDANALARRMASVKIYYDRARTLQKNYDSVIWYAHHKDMTYYYAVNGAFNFDSLKKEVKQSYKMGLIDENGSVIVPVAFDLIGNPSINLKAAVEVKKDGKIGYYTLDGREIVPAVYEWLIPYEEQETIALVKRDSFFGWLDKKYVFHENFPSAKAEQSVKEFAYLTSNTFSFGAQHNDLINVFYPLTEEFQSNGSGVIVPPAYFVRTGLFSSVEDRYLTDRRDSLIFQFGTEFIETKSQKPFSVSETIDAFISEFRARYVGGRQEFYMNYRITLVDKDRNILSNVHAYGDHDFQFRKKSDSLYESRATYEMGEGFAQEFNFPGYIYYRFDGRQFTQLMTNREFAFTEFVKMDSSYLTGDFMVWDDKIEKQRKSNFVSNKTLTYMRNEILAANGFAFKNSEQAQQFTYAQWYKPTIDSYDEVYAKFSDIDRHNLDFLNRLVGSTPDGKSI
jgi:hypothetical protein